MKHFKNKVWPHIWQRMRLILLLTLLGISVSVSMAPAAQTAYHIYALQNGNNVEFVCGEADFSYEGDWFYIKPFSGHEPQVVLRKGQPVTLHVNGKTLSAVSRLETVGNLLHRLHIALNRDDMIVFDLTAAQPDITITPEIRLLRDLEIPTGFQTERVANPLLAKGEERVKQEGVAGTIVETYEDVYHMGTLVGSEVVKRTNDTAVTEIIEYGTRVNSVSSGDRIASVHPNDSGSGGYLTFASGDTMTYSYVTTCNATAYSGGWGTASGAPVGPGTVAVDTSVFPFGTRFYIQASDGSWIYGMGTAKDRGGSIRGHKIDLWFHSYGTSCEWGRRDCTVYVLN